MITDDEVHKLIRKLGKAKERATIRRLLSGNDMQCFTTEQYITAHVKHEYGGDEFIGRILRDTRPGPQQPGEMLAHYHLRTLGVVREVAPDVWAPK